MNFKTQWKVESSALLKNEENFSILSLIQTCHQQGHVGSSNKDIWFLKPS